MALIFLISHMILTLLLLLAGCGPIFAMAFLPKSHSARNDLWARLGSSAQHSTRQEPRWFKAKAVNSVSAAGVEPQLTTSQRKESDHEVQ
jgi:hypothetical protein